jgi:nuclear cap-binding protein subunit 2
MAAYLYEDPNPDSEYIDRQQGYGTEEYKEKLKESTTLYIGNLSNYTKEEQIYELFSLCGKVKKVIMGLDRYKKTPCGFCFVEYFTHALAQCAINCLNSTQLENRVIRVDWDVGFKEGRQYGRGRGGGQKRDSVKNENEFHREDDLLDTDDIGLKRKRRN